MSSVSGKRNTDSIATVKVPSTLRRTRPTTQDEAYPAEVSLDPGASRRTRVRADEDPHDRKRVRHADQGADTRQAGSVSEADRIGATSHAGVKGEFVGKHVPPDGRYREPADLRTGSDWFRPIEKDTYVNMPKSHICINMT